METCPFDSYSSSTVDYTQFGMIMTPYFITGGYQANPATAGVRTYNAAGLPLNANIALFAANYPFQTMLPITATQDITKSECFLAWSEDNQAPTNDPYFPIKYSTIAGNLDWTKVIVHGTELKITFTNNFPVDVTVEVHLFKIIPDVDAFTAVGQIIALGTNSMINYDQYCRNGIKKWGIPQTETIKRDRFTLKCQNWQAASSIISSTTASAYFLGNNPKHQVTKTYMIKQKYSYVRPVSIVYEGVTPSETNFFNTFHDHQNSIYCKIMAWQKDGLTTQWVQLNESVANFTTSQYEVYRSQYQINNMNNVFSIASTSKGTNLLGYPISANNQDTIGRPLVEYKMQKRTFLQTDKIMLMGPFNQT